MIKYAILPRLVNSDFVGIRSYAKLKGRFQLGEKYRTERKFALENFREKILFDFH